MIRPHPPRGRAGWLAALLIASVLAVLAFPSIVAAQTTDGATEMVVDTTEIPTEVAPLVAKVTGGRVTLTWLEAGALQYAVLRSDDAGETFTEIAVVEAGLLTHTDERVAPGTYLYRVVADTSDPLLAPTLEVEVAPLPDPTPTPPGTETPDPGPGPAPRPRSEAQPAPAPDIPGLPGGDGSPEHGAEAPALPGRSSQDPHQAQPTSVRTAGADLRRIRGVKPPRLLPPRLLAGMISLTLPPQTAAPRPLAPVVADPAMPASVAAGAMPLGPAMASPPAPTLLQPASSAQPVSTPLALAFALLMATAFGHVARVVVAKAGRQDRQGRASGLLG